MIIQNEQINVKDIPPCSITIYNFLNFFYKPATTIKTYYFDIKF